MMPARNDVRYVKCIVIKALCDSPIIRSVEDAELMGFPYSYENLVSLQESQQKLPSMIRKHCTDCPSQCREVKNYKDNFEC